MRTFFEVTEIGVGCIMIILAIVLISIFNFIDCTFALIKKYRRKGK